MQNCQRKRALEGAVCNIQQRKRWCPVVRLNCSTEQHEIEHRFFRNTMQQTTKSLDGNRVTRSKCYETFEAYSNMEHKVGRSRTLLICKRCQWWIRPGKYGSTQRVPTIGSRDCMHNHQIREGLKVWDGIHKEGYWTFECWFNYRNPEWIFS